MLSEKQKIAIKLVKFNSNNLKGYNKKRKIIEIYKKLNSYLTNQID